MSTEEASARAAALTTLGSAALPSSASATAAPSTAPATSSGAPATAPTTKADGAAPEGRADHAPPLCARHSAVEAAAACARCGRFACAACLEEEDGQRFCLDCLARPEMRLRPSPRARQALWLSLLGLHGVVVFLPLGLWLAHQERLAIAAGAAPPAGRAWVQGARLAAMAGLVVWTAVGLVLAGR